MTKAFVLIEYDAFFRPNMIMCVEVLSKVQLNSSKGTIRAARITTQQQAPLCVPGRRQPDRCSRNRRLRGRQCLYWEASVRQRQQEYNTHMSYPGNGSRDVKLPW